MSTIEKESSGYKNINESFTKNLKYFANLMNKEEIGQIVYTGESQKRSDFEVCILRNFSGRFCKCHKIRLKKHYCKQLKPTWAEFSLL
jgi:hypothetical protein